MGPELDVAEAPRRLVRVQIEARGRARERIRLSWVDTTIFAGCVCRIRGEKAEAAADVEDASLSGGADP